MARKCIKCRFRIGMQMVNKHKWRSVFSSMGSDHNQKHSKMLDTCIDERIFDAVEFINTNICPTRYSCEGYETYPAGVTVSIDDWQKFKSWLHERDYTIGYAYDFYYEEYGWGIKRPAGFDFDVWIIDKNDVVNINFPKDYKEIFSPM
jgi:hypothetical protein